MTGVARRLSGHTVGPTAVVVLLCTVVLLTGSRTASSPLDDVREQLRARIESVRRGYADALRVGTVSLRTEESLIGYYQEDGFDPAWVDPGGPIVLSDSLIAALRDAESHGLRPTDYRIALLDSLRTRLRQMQTSGEPLSPRLLADFELLCTDAFLSFGMHVRGGRVQPSPEQTSPDHSHFSGAVVDGLRTALRNASVAAAIRTLRPPQAEYEALRRALARYRTLQAEGGWPRVPDGPALDPGTRSPQVRPLRARLRATGDLDRRASPPPDPAHYEERLERAVTAFQRRHGLTPDGVVGAATRSALNVPVETRIEQLRVNLERRRWLAHTLGDPRVEVNIANFRLRVVENEQTRLDMRVVIGTPYRQTPVFSDEISYLVFNPYWHVPHTLAIEDILPQLKRDPQVAAVRGYEILDGWGADAKTIDPSTIDWGSITASSFPYRIRQRPGPTNALGAVKFMFPNAHSVYLHDTPVRSGFERAERSASSGCIRVEQPVELAAYLLEKNDGWSRERVRRAMNGTTEQTVVLSRKVPVHLMYLTAWAEPGGTVHFRRDVYDRDAGVLAALEHPLPPHSSRVQIDR